MAAADSPLAALYSSCERLLSATVYVRSVSQRALQLRVQATERSTMLSGCESLSTLEAMMAAKDREIVQLTEQASRA